MTTDRLYIAAWKTGQGITRSQRLNDMEEQRSIVLRTVKSLRDTSKTLMKGERASGFGASTWGYRGPLKRGSDVMAYLVNIGIGGRIKENKYRVGSRGYHIYRKQKIVVCRWGRVSVCDRRGNMFTWSKTPQEQVYHHRTITAAKVFYAKQLRKMQLPHEAYQKLPIGWKIYSPVKKRIICR